MSVWVKRRKRKTSREDEKLYTGSDRGRPTNPNRALAAHVRFIYSGGSPHLAAAVPVRSMRARRNWLVPASTHTGPVTPCLFSFCSIACLLSGGRKEVFTQGDQEENRLEQHHFCVKISTVVAVEMFTGLEMVKGLRILPLERRLLCFAQRTSRLLMSIQEFLLSWHCHY